MSDHDNLLYQQQAMQLPLDPDSIMPQMEITPSKTPSMPPLSPSPTYTDYIQPECAQHNQYGFCLPQPYPPARAYAENERYARIIRNSFAGKESALTAMLTCIYHSIRFAECAADLQDILIDIAICKMHHLKLLGELLISLGSDPRFFCCLPPNANPGGWWSAQPSTVAYSKNLGEALHANIEAEKATLEEYHNAINYIDDDGICTLLKRIVLDKEYHLKIFTELYKRFCC